MQTTFNFLKSVSLVKYETPFIQGLDGFDWNYSPFVSEEQTKTMTKQVFPWAGLGLPVLRKEGQEAVYDNMAELPAMTMTVYKYNLSWKATDETLFYSQQNMGDLLGKAGKSMGANHKYLKGLLIANLTFNDLTSTTVYDGVAVCGTHTTRSGDTVDNALTAAVLDFDSYWDTWDFFRTSLISHAGVKYQKMAAYAQAHPSLRRNWEEIMNSSANPLALQSGVANTSHKVEFVEQLHATSTTAWALYTKEAKEDFRVYVAKAPYYKMDRDEDHEVTKYRSWQWLGMLPVDFPNVVYNPGAS